MEKWARDEGANGQSGDIGAIEAIEGKSLAGDEC